HCLLRAASVEGVARAVERLPELGEGPPGEPAEPAGGVRLGEEPAFHLRSELFPQLGHAAPGQRRLASVHPDDCRAARACIAILREREHQEELEHGSWVSVPERAGSLCPRDGSPPRTRWASVPSPGSDGSRERGRTRACPRA